MMDDVGLPGKSSAGEYDLTSGQMRPPFLTLHVCLRTCMFGSALRMGEGRCGGLNRVSDHDKVGTSQRKEERDREGVPGSPKQPLTKQADWKDLTNGQGWLLEAWESWKLGQRTKSFRKTRITHSFVYSNQYLTQWLFTEWMKKKKKTVKIAISRCPTLTKEMGNIVGAGNQQRWMGIVEAITFSCLSLQVWQHLFWLANAYILEVSKYFTLFSWVRV